MTTAAVAVDLPQPLVGPRHPVQFAKNHLMLLVYAVIFAHIGEFIIAALYYLITQTNPTMNAAWHSLVSDSSLRHAIRDVGEGVLGGLLAQAVIYNYFKRGNRRVGRLTTTLKERFHIPVTFAAVVAAVILGSISFTVSYYVINLFHPHDTTMAATSGSLWYRTYTNLWATNVPLKVLGLIAAFGARKPLRVVFSNAQAWFVERKIDNSRKVWWFYPPTYRARYNYLLTAPDERHVGYATWQNLLMGATCLIGLGLAGYGYYVLTYIA